MDKSLNNLCALIDSGKEENLEIALRLSHALADEWKWIHTMLQSKKRLPKGSTSWYQVFALAVKFDLDRVQVISNSKQGETETKEYSMFEIHQGVTLEMHYKLFRLELGKLYDDLNLAYDGLQRQYLPPDAIKQNACVSLASWAIELLEKEDQ